MIKRKYIILLIIVLLGLIFHKKTVFEGHPWVGGSFQYLIQAQAIKNGQVEEASKKINAFHTNAQTSIPGVYPWGYPLVIASLNGTSLSDLDWYKYFNIALLIAGSVVWWFWGFRRIKNWSFLLLVLILFNPYLAYFKNIIYSDIPLFFFTSLFFLCWDEIKDKQTPTNILIIGMVYCWCVMVRIQGALLFIPVCLLLKTEWRKWGYFTMPVLTYFLLIRPFLFPHSGLTYFDSLEESMQMVVENIIYYPTQMYRLFYYKYENDIWSIGGYLLGLFFFLLGIAKTLKTHWQEVLFLGGNLMLLIFWPFQEGPRFIIFMLPLIFYFMAHGMKSLSDRYRFFYVFPFLVMIVYVRNDKSAWIHGNREKNSVSGKEAQEMFQFVKDHSEKEYVFYRPRILYWYTGKEALALTQEHNLPFKTFSFIKVKSRVALQLSVEKLEQLGYTTKKVYQSNQFEIFDVKDGMK